MKRRPSRTRVVGYTFDGTIDLIAASNILAKALAANVVTEFDSTKSCEPGLDCVWFNGPPGPALREVRDAIAALVVSR